MGVITPGPTVTGGGTTVKNVKTITCDTGLTVTDRTNRNAELDVSGAFAATLTDSQVGFGDGSDLLTGSADFTYTVDAGTGPDLTVKGAQPSFTLKDDTEANTYETQLEQSGNSLYVYGTKDEDDTMEYIRLAHSTSAPEILINNDASDMDVTIKSSNADRSVVFNAGDGIVYFKKYRIQAQSDNSVQPAIQLYEDNDDTGAGPRLYFRRDAEEPEAYDDLGSITFYGSVIQPNETVVNDKQYAQIFTEIKSPTRTDGGTDQQTGILRFNTITTGSANEHLRLQEKKASVGYQSGDVIDFAVYNSDSSAMLLQCDASADEVSVNGKLDVSSYLTANAGVRSMASVITFTEDVTLGSSLDACGGQTYVLLSATDRTLTLPESAPRGYHFSFVSPSGDGGGSITIQAQTGDTVNGLSSVSRGVDDDIDHVICYDTGKWICGNT